MSNSTEKLLNALEKGSTITPAQAVSRFGFSNAAAVKAAVRGLRNSGYMVYINESSSGVNYRIGTPTKRIIAAGIKAVK